MIRAACLMLVIPGLAACAHPKRHVLATPPRTDGLHVLLGAQPGTTPAMKIAGATSGTRLCIQIPGTTPDVDDALQATLRDLGQELERSSTAANRTRLRGDPATGDVHLELRRGSLDWKIDIHLQVMSISKTADDTGWCYDVRVFMDTIYNVPSPDLKIGALATMQAADDQLRASVGALLARGTTAATNAPSYTRSCR